MLVKNIALIKNVLFSQDVKSELVNHKGYFKRKDADDRIQEKLRSKKKKHPSH